MATTTTMTKELVIVSGDIKGEVEVCQTDTLHDVRALILQEFNDDMLPFEDFCFHVNDIRISKKQECKKRLGMFLPSVCIPNPCNEAPKAN
jgi:hypothetical protein